MLIENGTCWDSGDLQRLCGLALDKSKHLLPDDFLLVFIPGNPGAPASGYFWGSYWGEWRKTSPGNTCIIELATPKRNYAAPMEQFAADSIIPPDALLKFIGAVRLLASQWCVDTTAAPSMLDLPGIPVSSLRLNATTRRGKTPEFAKRRIEYLEQEIEWAKAGAARRIDAYRSKIAGLEKRL